jgi:hypothetical protein
MYNMFVESLPSFGEIMSDNLSVIEKGGKYIVASNGQPVQLPKSDGAAVTTEFDSKQDAERYISILKRLPPKRTKSRS